MADPSPADDASPRERAPPPPYSASHAASPPNSTTTAGGGAVGGEERSPDSASGGSPTGDRASWGKDARGLQRKVLNAQVKYANQLFRKIAEENGLVDAPVSDARASWKKRREEMKAAKEDDGAVAAAAAAASPEKPAEAAIEPSSAPPRGDESGKTPPTVGASPAEDRSQPPSGVAEVAGDAGSSRIRTFRDMAQIT